jgi:hypothetical protein
VSSAKKSQFILFPFTRAANLAVGRLYFKRFVADNRPLKGNIVKRFVFFLVLALITGGCATSTVEKRKAERASAYEELSPAMRALIDQGQIKVGMPMVGVYIVWGKPSQVATGELSNGKPTTTWLYTGTTWREHRYWNYRYYGNRYGYPEAYLDYDYLPSSYVAAEVLFEDGLVRSWRNISQPPPY